MEKYNRKAIFSNLKKYCTFAKEEHFIEIIEWKNGEGFDVDIHSNLPTRFQLTYGEFDAMKKLIKELNR